MNRLAKQNEYLFMKDGARAHTVKLIGERMKFKKQLRLLKHQRWPLKSQNLDTVDFGI